MNAERTYDGLRISKDSQPDLVEDFYTSSFRSTIRWYLYIKGLPYQIAEQLAGDVIATSFEGSLKEESIGRGYIVRCSEWLYNRKRRVKNEILFRSVDHSDPDEHDYFLEWTFRSDQTPEVAYEQKEEVRIFMECLNSIYWRHRNALLLHHYAEMTYREVADFMECSPAVAKQLCREGREKFKSTYRLLTGDHPTEDEYELR